MKIKKIIACVLAAACMAFTAGCAAEKGAEGNIKDIVLKSGDKIAEFNIEGYGTIKAKLLPEVAPEGVENFVKLADSGYYDGLTIHRVVADFMLQGGSLNGDGTGGEAADGGSFGVEINKDARHFYGALCYANAAGQNTCQFYIVNNNKPQDLSTFNIQDIKDTAEIFATYKSMCQQGTDAYAYYEVMEKYYTNMADFIETASDEVKDKYLEVGGTPSLDGGYTVFGQVYEGFDVIDAISASEVEMNEGGENSKPVETITITSVKVTEYTE